MDVQPTGQVLLLYLKRFDDRVCKITKNASFPRGLPVGNVRYIFAAMVEHKGATRQTGHYVTYVDAQNMLCCDDNEVVATTWSHIESQAAYIPAYMCED